MAAVEERQTRRGPENEAEAMAHRRRIQKMQLGVFLIVVAVLPLVLQAMRPNDYRYYLHILVFIGLNLILATGLNLLMGYAGQVSLGHAAFYGLGAYTSGILTARYGWNPWAAMLAALVLTCFVAWLVGKPALRLKGHYLAMATLGVGIIVAVVIRQWTSLTGGSAGLLQIPSMTLFGFEFQSNMDTHYYYFVWAWVLLLTVIFANLVQSRPGRALRALHDSELAAQTLGVDTAGFKVRAFVVSAAYASIAGTLYAHSSMRFLSPTPFDFHTSIALLVMVVLGGQGTLWGPVVGAVTITFINETLRPYTNYDIVVYGLLLMILMIVMPGGLARGLAALWNWLLDRFSRSSQGEQQ